MGWGAGRRQGGAGFTKLGITKTRDLSWREDKEFLRIPILLFFAKGASVRSLCFPLFKTVAMYRQIAKFPPAPNRFRFIFLLSTIRVYALSWPLDFDFTYSYIEYSIIFLPLFLANLGIPFSYDHGGRRNPSLSARPCSR